MTPLRRHRLAREMRDLLGLAGPIVASQLGQIGMNTTDTIMVGHLGPLPLAAVGLGSALHTLALMIGAGVLVGMNPLVSQAFGARDLAETRAVLRQGFWLALLLSVPVSLVTVLGEPLARLFGQEPGVAAAAGDYMLALAPGVAPVLLFMALRQYLEAIGEARPPMIATFAGLALNVGANRVLIYGAGSIPAMGAVGSGWATTIVRWFMFFALLAYVAAKGRLSPFRIEPGLFDSAAAAWRPARARLERMVKVGGPIGLQFGLEVGLFAFAAVMMGWIGPVELAAHQVTINLAATTFMVALGTSMAGSVRVGQHVGAGRPRAVRRAVIATYLLTLGFMGACGLLFLTLPGPLVRLYTDDAAILEIGRRLLLVAAAFQLFDGAQVAGMGVLRGAGDTRVPMLYAAAGYWGAGVATALVLGFATPLGPVGVWAGLCAGLAAVAVTLAVRARHVLWLRDPVALREAEATPSATPE